MLFVNKYINICTSTTPCHMCVCTCVLLWLMRGDVPHSMTPSVAIVPCTSSPPTWSYLLKCLLVANDRVIPMQVNQSLRSFGGLSRNDVQCMLYQHPDGLPDNIRSGLNSKVDQLLKVGVV